MELANEFLNGIWNKEPKNHYLEETIRQFQRIAKFSIQNPRYFGGQVSCGFVKDKERIYVGEAGGFQDGL